MAKTLLQDQHGNFIDRRRKPGTKIDSIKAGRTRRRPRLETPDVPLATKPSEPPRASFGQRSATAVGTRLQAKETPKRPKP